MQVLLNGVWLAICLATVARCLTRPRLGRRCSVYPALVCFCVLLFPIISASDDLLAFPSSTEDPTSTTVTLKARTSEDGKFTAGLHSATQMAELWVAPAFAVVGDVWDVVPFTSAVLFSRGCGERAPPVAIV